MLKKITCKDCTIKNVLAAIGGENNKMYRAIITDIFRDSQDYTGNKKERLLANLKDIASQYGVSTNVHGDYPGWAYKEDSPLRERMVSVYEEMYGSKPEIQALHAGLECGIFAGKIQGLDCISFGPNLYDIHTTKERLSLSSAERTWKFILKVLS